MKQIKRIRKTLTSAALVAVLLFTTAHAAGGFESSTLATGTKKLIQDVMNWLVIICPIAGGAAGVTFLIRKGIADEQDGKMWMKRFWVAVACGVGGALVSGIISMLASYY
jgi:Na+/H+ antiporter NhaA